MTQAAGDSSALSRFEEFLVRYHEDGASASLDALCAEHPAHAERFRRWWDQLVRAGEVSDRGGSSGGEPVEGGRFGPYRLGRELGRGAQGIVFLAEDQRLKRAVALKVLPPHRARGRDFVQRFAREAELASRLDDPGIVTVFERGEIDGAVFLAMRHVDGESLAAKIARAVRRREAGGDGICVRLPGPDDDGEALDERAAIARLLGTFERIARALDVAHARSLVHRDVKPGNLLIDRRGAPVLLDFGLARDLEQPALTLTGDLVGTPAYLSPEQIAALRIELDRRTDIWSLGVTLYECLTLERPFEGATRDQLYQQILTAEPASLRQRNPRVSRDLETVVATALQKDRNRRYQTARDFAEDLRRIVAHEPIRARPLGPLARLARWTRRNPGLAAATALAFLGLSLGLLLSLAYVAEARRARTAFQRLDDVTLLAQARAAADSLYPILPARAAGFGGWVERHGAPLAARLPAHRAELERLRAHALPRDPAADEQLRQASPLQAERAQVRAELEAYEVAEVPGENRRAEVVRHVLGWLADRSRARLDAIEAELAALRAWRFAALEAQAAHDALAALVAELERFTAPDGLAPRIAREAGIAAAMASGGGSDVDWAAAATRVRAQTKYRGQALARQPGLVPLGPDPDSRLEEFALLGSGVVPSRDPATGRLAAGPEHAAVLVLVPPGELRPAADDLQPEPVQLDWFLIGKHELTRGQWRRMFAEPPPNSDLVLAAGDPRDELPVDAVAWVVADRLLPRWDLRLPTEAQWEHAARGGSGGRHWWGDGLPPSGAAPAANIADASYVVATGQVRRLPVGYDDGHVLLAPIGVTACNGYGLGDVYGNVAELCREPFAGALPLGRFPFDAGDGLHRVPPTRQRAIRGGWFGAAWRTIGLGERDGIPETVATVGVGLRVARRVAGG